MLIFKGSKIATKLRAVTAGTGLAGDESSNIVIFCIRALRPLMAESLQSFKADLFKALAHPARVRILELLRDGEKSVSELQLGLGTEGSTVSQQLAILRMKNLVHTRKAGTQIYYRVRDAQVTQILDVARAMFDAHLAQLQSIPREMELPATAVR